MESVDIFLNITTFGFWGSPSWQKIVKMGWVLLYPAVLSNINCTKIFFLRFVIDVRERVWYLEGPKQNNAKIIILRDFQCALVHYILQRCYELLLLTVINGYQFLWMVIRFNISNSIICELYQIWRSLLGKILVNSITTKIQQISYVHTSIDVRTWMHGPSPPD